MARASPAGTKLDLGASIPAKALVEHKAEDGTKNVSGKGRNIYMACISKKLSKKSLVRLLFGSIALIECLFFHGELIFY